METAESSFAKSLKPLQDQLLNHEIYTKISNPEALRRFMEYHVYAVWDFMSLLKSLQIQLTCTAIPWLPVNDAETAYLINEIVTGEETDIDENNHRMSHFEWYLKAMDQAGANTKSIHIFLKALRQGVSLEKAFDYAGTPLRTRQFVNHTFSIIRSGKPWVQAAAFTFGREDLIPPMFIRMVNTWEAPFREKFDAFINYLNRHIEIDGDEHSHMALTMTERLCTSNQKRKEALMAAMESLQQRILLWDAVCLALD